MVHIATGQGEPLSKENSAEHTRRILIVEDNALVAKFFRMALERAGGFACVVTEDVPFVLAEVRAEKVDLVLCWAKAISPRGTWVKARGQCAICPTRNPQSTSKPAQATFYQ